MFQRLMNLINPQKLKSNKISMDEYDSMRRSIIDEYDSMRRAIIVDWLKNYSLFKINLTSSYFLDTNLEEQEKMFSKFRNEICSSKIIKYHCCISVDSENSEEITYIAIESCDEDEIELSNIAQCYNISIEPVMGKPNKIKILSSEYIGISEPQKQRVLRVLEDLDRLAGRSNTGRNKRNDKSI